MTDIQNPDSFSDGRMTDDEWANRRLCPDGNCIGVIGADGRSKECGRPGDDTLVEAPLGEADADEAPAAAGAPSENRADADEDDWENRRLCPDGNCIGVIGPDGRCKECGRPDENP